MIKHVISSVLFLVTLAGCHNSANIAMVNADSKHVESSNIEFENARINGDAITGVYNFLTYDSFTNTCSFSDNNKNSVRLKCTTEDAHLLRRKPFQACVSYYRNQSNVLEIGAVCGTGSKEKSGYGYYFPRRSGGAHDCTFAMDTGKTEHMACTDVDQKSLHNISDHDSLLAIVYYDYSNNNEDIKLYKYAIAIPRRLPEGAQPAIFSGYYQHDNGNDCVFRRSTGNMIVLGCAMEAKKALEQIKYADTLITVNYYRQDADSTVKKYNLISYK